MIKVRIVMKYKGMLAACCMALVCFSSTAQNSMPSVLAELKALGFPDVRSESFASTNENLSITAIHPLKESAEEPRKGSLMYLVKVSPLPEGLLMLLAEFVPCKPGFTALDLTEIVIRVNGQKINAVRNCVAIEGKADTQFIYSAKNKSGNDFIIKQFREKEVVVVHLNSIPIPFKTEGFAEVAKKLGGKAL